jgi:hypothetical protein
MMGLIRRTSLRQQPVRAITSSSYVDCSTCPGVARGFRALTQLQHKGRSAVGLPWTGSGWTVQTRSPASPHLAQAGGLKGPVQAECREVQYWEVAPGAPAVPPAACCLLTTGGTRITSTVLCLIESRALCQTVQSVPCQSAARGVRGLPHDQPLTALQG